MDNYLSASYGTGTTILSNIDQFKYELESENEDHYKFTWVFGNQFGYISIFIKDGEVTEDSIICTDQKCDHKFERPLGLYNDPSLSELFCDILKSTKNSI